MAIIHIALSAGSQIGPLIAGYLIDARGWQWFFKLTSILIGINLFFVLFFLPETNFRRKIKDGEPAPELVQGGPSDNIGDAEKVEDVAETSLPESAAEYNEPYAGSYWKDLVQFRNRGLIGSNTKSLLRCAIEPPQFFAVPQALYAGVSFGVIIGG